MTEYQQDYMLPLLEKFRMKASHLSEASARNYHKAIGSFEAFAGQSVHDASLPSEPLLADWTVSMWLQGLTAKTMGHYIDIIAALYKETAPQDASDDFSLLFRSFKTKLRTLDAPDSLQPLRQNELHQLRTLLKSPHFLRKDAAMAADILLASLTDMARPLKEVALLKTSDIDLEVPGMEGIVARQSSPRRKYLFSLNQSRLTDRQLGAMVAHLVGSLLRSRNITPVSGIDSFVKTVWAYAALSCGASGSEVTGVLGTAPSGIPVLSLCQAAEVSEARSASIARSVASIFLDNPMRWYAMKLRPRVDYEQMTARVKALEGVTLPEFFYPYEEIAKKIGKKLVFDKKPVIRDIVFFRSRVTDIFPIFSKIGDIAWCYTTSGKPGGDYAAIPNASFALFQQTIGHFTPDYEIAPIGGFAPVAGEHVVVVNGLLARQEFDVEKIASDGDTVFELRMVGSNGIQWRTKAKAHQLTPAATQLRS